MELDDPPDFDIWCALNGTPMAAAAWIAAAQSIAVLDVYKAIRNWLEDGDHIPVFTSRGWSDLPHLKRELPAFVDKASAMISESSFHPLRCRSHCEQHALWYVSENCPICKGFYIDKVVYSETGRTAYLNSSPAAAPAGESWLKPEVWLSEGKTAGDSPSFLVKQ